MFLHRTIYLIREKLKTSRTARILSRLFVVVVVLLFVSVGLFWLEYTGRDEQIQARYPALGWVDKLPKLLDVYYLPLMFKSSTLPSYNLEVDEEYLSRLDKILPKDQCINCLPEEAAKGEPAKFVFNGEEHQVKIRVRGDSWNHWAYAKKSWRIKFDTDSPLDGYDEFDLIIPQDREFVAEYLNNYRARKLGLAVPEMKFVTLRINGKYYGVYLQQGRIDTQMLERNQQAPNSNIYGDRLITDRLFLDPTDWKKDNQDDISKIDNYAELNYLLEIINNTSDEEFAAKIPELVDMDNFYRWTVLSMLAGSYHQDFAHNMRIYFDISVGKFKFIPVDVGISMLPTVDIIYNPLADRIMKNPEFVDARNKILWGYIQDDDNLNDDLRVYDETYNQIRWPTYRDSKNNYSNFYFDRKVELRKERFKEIYREAQGVLSTTGQVGAIIDLSDNLVSQRSGFKVVAGLDFMVNNFSGVSLNEVEVKLNDKNTVGNLVLFYDENRNQILDNQDKELGHFEKIDDKKFTVKLNQNMLADRWMPDLIDYSSDDYVAGRGPILKEIRVKMTKHIFWLASSDSQVMANSQRFDKFTFYLKNAITKEKVGYNDVKMDNTTFEHFDEILLTPAEFVNRNPQFRLNNKGEVILGPGLFEITKTTIIPKQVVKFKIEAGTTLRLAPGVSIFNYAPLEALGDSGRQIVIERLNPQSPWGVLVTVDQREKLSRVEYLKVSGGADAYVNGVYVSGQLSFYWSDVEIKNSEFSNASGDDSLNVKRCKVNLVGNKFFNNGFDAIDMDFGDPRGVIADNIFNGNGNDAIDISGSAILIEKNHVLSSGDKCISVGENSSPVIFDNILENCQIGIAAKDLSQPLIINDTINNNKQGIAAYQKKAFFGGGTAWVYHSWLKNNQDDYETDDQSVINQIDSLENLKTHLKIDLEDIR